MMTGVGKVPALLMNALTFAHISDLHLPFDPKLSLAQRFSKRQLSVWSWRRRRSLQRPEILSALASDLQSQRPDHIVVTGDITNFSLPGEFRSAASWLEALLPSARLSIVPGNHDALVPVAQYESTGLWANWMGGATVAWPYVHRHDGVSFIGLNSALPTAPLLASGRLGAPQLQKLETLLRNEAAAGQKRVLLLHHPVADGAVSWRKALADRETLRFVLARAGAELILHGHARDARLDPIAGPNGPIPCLCVPSSSAVPNPQDEGARWHRVRFAGFADSGRVEVLVRRWSVSVQAFVDAACYELCLPQAVK
jgi:3',5'-cyclic AMP phosphodiesterase CpdA